MCADEVDDYGHVVSYSTPVSLYSTTTDPAVSSSSGCRGSIRPPLVHPHVELVLAVNSVLRGVDLVLIARALGRYYLGEKMGDEQRGCVQRRSAEGSKRGHGTTKCKRIVRTRCRLMITFARRCYNKPLDIPFSLCGIPCTVPERALLQPVRNRARAEDEADQSGGMRHRLFSWKGAKGKSDPFAVRTRGFTPV
jgi:hypothetical protein